MDLAFYHAAEQLGIEVVNARPYLTRGFHPVMARYMMYEDYLATFAQRFRKVLLTDLRDVVFQGDPFAEPLHTEVSFAAEDDTIGPCPWNSSWLRMAYGEAVLEELADRQISCSGTTIGEADGIVRYLRTMRTEIETRPYDRTTFGVDQGIHNYIVWKLRPAYGRLDIVNSVVKTLYYTSKDRVQVTDGRITVDGRAAPVIHKYDSHPDLLAHVASAAPPPRQDVRREGVAQTRTCRPSAATRRLYRREGSANQPYNCAMCGGGASDRGDRNRDILEGHLPSTLDDGPLAVGITANSTSRRQACLVTYAPPLQQTTPTSIAITSPRGPCVFKLFMCQRSTNCINQKDY